MTFTRYEATDPEQMATTPVGTARAAMQDARSRQVGSTIAACRGW